MRAFLNVINVVGCYGGLAMLPVYFAAQVFVMRNAELQAFLLDYGDGLIFGPLAASLIAGWTKHRLETSKTPNIA